MLVIVITALSVHNILVSAGRNESWLYHSGADEVIVCHAQSFRCPKVSDLAQDGQAFVSFMAHNYDRLENVRLAFVHGGLHEWHHDNIQEKVRAAWSTQQFVHLGNPHRRKCIDIEDTGWCTNILKPHRISCDMNICTYQGLEFVASTINIQNISLRQWQGIEKTCNGFDVPQREFGKGFKGCSFAMEYLAQALVGGPLHLPEAKSEL